MFNLKNLQLKKTKSIDELVVNKKLSFGRSAEKISDLVDIPLETVIEMQDTYWEDYAKELSK